MVVLGGPANGAKVLLTTEFTRLVIDDVLLIAGVEPRQQAQLKKTMRFQISGSRTAATVIQTGHSNRSTATTSRRFSTSPVTFSSGLNPDDSAFQSNSLPERPLTNQSLRYQPLPNQPLPNRSSQAVNRALHTVPGSVERREVGPSLQSTLPHEETHLPIAPRFNPRVGGVGTVPGLNQYSGSGIR